MRIAEKTTCLPDPLVPLDTKERVRPSPGQRSSKKSGAGRSNGTATGKGQQQRSSLESNHSSNAAGGILQPSGSSGHQLNNHHEGNNSLVKLEAAVDSGSRDSRGTSIDRFSDISRHSNSSRGYLVSN